MIKIIYKNQYLNIEKNKLIKKSKYFENLLSDYDLNEIDLTETKHNIFKILNNEVNLKNYKIIKYYLFNINDYIDKLNKEPIKNLKLYIELSKTYNLDGSLLKTNLMEIEDIKDIKILDIINIFERKQYADIFNQYQKEINIFKLNITYHQLNDNNYYIHSNPYKENEKHIIDNIEIFKEKLFDYSSGFINNEFINFIKENNIIIAGGTIINLLLNNAKYNNDSDIDIFVSDMYNLKKILNYIDDRINNVKYYVQNSCITLMINGVRNIQIILTYTNNYLDVIKNFDLDYCKCYFDGISIYGTYNFIKSLTYMTVFTKFKYTYNFHSRIIKAYKKRFNILKENIRYNICYTKKKIKKRKLNIGKILKKVDHNYFFQEHKTRKMIYDDDYVKQFYLIDYLCLIRKNKLYIKLDSYGLNMINKKKILKKDEYGYFICLDFFNIPGKYIENIIVETTIKIENENINFEYFIPHNDDKNFTYGEYIVIKDIYL